MSSVNLNKTLVIGISSSALFDSSKENKIFQTKGIKEYKEYQLKNEDTILPKGTAFPLVELLLKLNTHFSKEAPLVEVVVMSRNSCDIGLRILNSIEQYKLNITRSCFTSGKPVSPYIKAYNVDLFLSRNSQDVQEVIDSKKCAAALLYSPPKELYEQKEKKLRIAFDADAVIFSDESEQIYKTHGLEKFKELEEQKFDIPLKPGPFARFFTSLHTIQNKFDNPEDCPLELGIITARNSPAHKRLILTLRNWGISINQIFFLGGLDKNPIIRAYKPHIYFDDQHKHLKDSFQSVASGIVPYPKDSDLHKNQQEDIDKRFE